MEKISVIVPVYNIAPYIERCVNSICSQSDTNLEIFLVNDGSTDNSLEILQGLASRDERIVVINKINGGVTSARLEGLKNASGDWVSFIDGDDEMEPDMYEKLLNNAHKYNADISHCGYQVVFPSHIDYYFNTGKIVIQNNEKGVKDLLEAKFIEPGLTCKLFKSELLKNISLKMDLQIKNNEDLLMNYYIFKQSQLSVFEDICPYYYILRKGSATQSSTTNIHKTKDSIKVLKIIKNDCNNQIIKNIINKRIVFRFIECIENKETSIQAIQELKSLLSEKDSIFDLKTYVFAKWCIISPLTYKLIHHIYGKIKRNQKKFKL